MEGERAVKILKALGVGRFQVMALLQAARYFVLTGDLERAKSFGLNRAIFYAWAKYHGPKARRAGAAAQTESTKDFVEVLGERVQRGRQGYYAIGGQEQRPRDFDEQVFRKIGVVLKPEEVWQAAVEYVKQFPEWVLRNPRYFFEYVYKPVRDTFLFDLARGERPRPPARIMERVKALSGLLAYREEGKEDGGGDQAEDRARDGDH